MSPTEVLVPTEDAIALLRQPCLRQNSPGYSIIPIMSTTPSFGLWPSPLTPRQMAASVRIDDLQWDSDGRHLVWLESRDGRGSLWGLEVASGDAPRELTPGALAVRGRVGYGGGEFAVAHGSVFFAEASSGRLFRQALSGGMPEPLTPAFGAACSPAPSPDAQHLLFVHSYEEQDCLAVVDTAGQHWPQRVATGHDFYMWPCWHPAGTHVAFVAWDHPNMPWDGTGLYLAEVDRRGPLPELRNLTMVAGGPHTSIFQPSFAPDGRFLAFVSDQAGWWQIYLHDLATGTQHRLTDATAEYAHPAWAYGQRAYAWGRAGRRIYALRNDDGVRRIEVHPVDGGPPQVLSDGEGYAWFSQPAADPNADALAGTASAPTVPQRLLIADGTSTRIVRRSSGELIPAAQLAQALPVSWSAGAEQVYGLLYLPPGYQPGASGPRPPAIIRIHGGPTDQAVASYSGEIQFLATRGYVVLEVNYRGSTGYGRTYAQALNEAWGEYDVTDTIAGACYLVEAGIADPARLVVMGGSAGGLTVLAALCREPDLFRAGVCRYGVANLFTLAADTHKFEARYLDRLVGPLPETAARYRERSPIFQIDRLRTPLAIYQGAEDKVVPPDQAEAIVGALRRRGVPHIYHLFPGEGHGWRRTETIITYYQTLDAFLREFVVF
ncbi:MAG: S9 family peptidase [Oscillochloridaceae bacterium umkhey_bin13]